jgi:GNAT superfamily N-acetyltransferase
MRLVPTEVETPLGSLVQIETLTEAQTVELHALFQDEWWTKGRQLDDVRAMLKGSLVIAFAEFQTGRLVAFCRLLTDFVYRGMIHDVIVAPPWRGHRLGRRLVEAILNDPRLQRVEVLTLSCVPEMVPFYEKWGFQVLIDDRRRWMMRPRAGSMENLQEP